MAEELRQGVGQTPLLGVTEASWKSLEEAWLELNVRIGLLKSFDPEKQELLRKIKVKLAEIRTMISELQLT